MTRVIIILLLLFGGISQTNSQELLYKHNRPTSKGISSYIKANEINFIEDFQKFVGDTLMDVYIEVDNLSEYTEHDSLELGRFYLPNDIIITNEEMFLDYRLQYLSKFRKGLYLENNQFVYATVMHELMHFYFYQILLESRYAGKSISPEYAANFRMFPVYEYGAEFIEEGICEYLVNKMQEIIPFKTTKQYDREYLVDNKNKYEIKYRYSSQYVQDFLNNRGLKQGIIILIQNKPPSIEEIINPQKFYSRLSIY
jgi:hypothetical protein